MVESGHWYHVYPEAPVSTSLQGLFISYLVVSRRIFCHTNKLMDAREPAESL